MDKKRNKRLLVLFYPNVSPCPQRRSASLVKLVNMLVFPWLEPSWHLELLESMSLCLTEQAGEEVASVPQRPVLASSSSTSSSKENTFVPSSTILSDSSSNSQFVLGGLEGSFFFEEKTVTTLPHDCAVKKENSQSNPII